MKIIDNVMYADDGKKFIRIHDNQDMGNIIYLGIDYSYDKNGRVDLPQYYREEVDKSIVIKES